MARPEVLSVSQINTFLLCPRLYRYRYIERREPERKSVNLAFGTAVHSTIGWWQEQRMSGANPTDEALSAVYRADWACEKDVDGFDAEGKDIEALGALGRDLVGLFVEHFEDDIPDEVEKRLEVELPVNGGVPFVGYLDFVADGVVGEIKTTARKSSPSNWSNQLSAYSYMYLENFGVMPKVQLVQLVKTKKPQLLVEELTVPFDEVAWFLEVAGEVDAAVDAGTFFPSPSWACKNCSYREACRG